MFTILLPYSKQKFLLKKLTFEQILDLSCINQDGTTEDLINYLEAFFETRSLCAIDKFYIFLKARELFIDSTLTMLTKDDSTMKLNISVLLNKFTDMSNYSKKATINNISFLLDAPDAFIYDEKSAIYDSVIFSITVDDTIMSFNTLPDIEKSIILENLPPTCFKVIKNYLDELYVVLTLFDGKESLGVDPIVIDFLTPDPANFIKALYNEYSTHTCRDIILYLSSRIGESILLKSTPLDVTSYIDDISKQNEKSKSGNTPSIV